MAIDEKQVRHIALLARVTLTDEEIKLFSHQLDDILQYIEKLGEIDTENVEPMTNALTHFNVMREDEPAASLDPMEAVANAPSRQDAFYKVPKVVE